MRADAITLELPRLEFYPLYNRDNTAVCGTISYTITIVSPSDVALEEPVISNWQLKDNAPINSMAYPSFQI